MQNRFAACPDKPVGDTKNERYFARLLPYRKNKILDQDNYAAVLFLLWR